MLAIVAPGQGAQTPGFLTPWLEHPVPRGCAARCREGHRPRPRPPRHDGDADEIRDTAVAQPLLAALALGHRAALELCPSGIDVVAGHSIGELPAAALAGALTPDAALRSPASAVARWPRHAPPRTPA